MLDSELYTKYNRYYEKYMLKKEGKWEMSLLSGENAYCTLFGKRKLLPDTPTAKIYSSNYTKLHPTETGKAKPDAYIGITDSYKFHHALRYLIRNGKKWGNMTLISWCPSGNIANPLQSVQEYIMNATGEVMDHVNFNGDLYSEVIETDTNLFNTLDTIREMYIKKYKKMMIHVVGLTAVTQGCINTVYRAEIPAELYFNNLTNYYKNGIQSYYDYYRFDGIQSILRVLDSQRQNDVGSFLSLLNYAIYNSNIAYNVMRKMMNQYDIMMYDKWYAFQYFNKFFNKFKDEKSFAYLMGRWVGICAAVSFYSNSLYKKKTEIDSKFFLKIKNNPFEYMPPLSKQLNICEQILTHKSNYLIDIKNKLSIKLAGELHPTSSASDINYYLGYEDQIKEVTEINLEKKEKKSVIE
ncbi:type I-C CRISPR-associated protein Cas8c/Csd1 [[Clostridium] innocuum]|nr:type I-C CRISPR-associated protein Cas8c/Csd1 [[Clostridium] innocuum]